MQEVWKDVIGYEDLFQVSNLGNFYSKRSDKILKQHITKTGYCLVSTKIGGRKGIAKCFRVHREVAKAFLDAPSPCKLDWAKDTVYGVVEVNHIDGNKANNNVDNLEWVTASENLIHYRQELDGKNRINDKRHPDTKLSDEQVRQIRTLVSEGYSERKLAKMFNVSRISITNAKRGYKWVE